MKTGQALFTHLAKLQKRSTVASAARRRAIARIGGLASGKARKRRRRIVQLQKRIEHAAKGMAKMLPACAPQAAHATLWGRMLLFMEPGQWYGRSDLMRALEAGREARGVVNQRLLARGYVERVANPAYRGPVGPQRAREHAEPLWLYRLSAEGEAERTRLGAAREAGDMSPRPNPYACAGRSAAERSAIGKAMEARRRDLHGGARA